MFVTLQEWMNQHKNKKNVSKHDCQNENLIFYVICNNISIMKTTNRWRFCIETLAFKLMIPDRIRVDQI